MIDATTERVAVSRDKLREELLGYDFESPTGASLDVLIAPLMDADLDKHTARTICDDIERSYHFYGDAGFLRNCAAWVELRRRVAGEWG